MLTPEQSNQIKERLLQQVKNFPEDKQEIVKKQILSMTDEQLEQFIKQNQLSHLESSDKQETQQCIFCSILSGQIPSYKLIEDKYSIAILEINPLSKGHSLILPRIHQDVTKIPSSSFSLAKRISKKIKSKYKPQEIQISSKNMFGHGVIEIIPLYGDEKERHKATEEELTKLQNDLKIEKRERRTIKKKSSKKIKSETAGLPILKPRIP
jgi:histidine triad (HIT) family protein